MKNKRGDQKYYIIMSLILGLAILAISLYFIFNEYFTEDELNWEACRQSILLRTAIPDTTDKTGLNMKDSFALKCKTQVVTIDGDSYDDVNKVVADTIAKCWYTYGEGKFDFFVTKYWSRHTYGMVCARFRFSPEFIEKYNNKELTGDASFSNYYETGTVGNSQETYESYLPYYDVDGKAGGFLSWVNYINPEEDNYFVVYTQYKHLGGAKLFGIFWWKDQIEDSERPIIQLIPEKYLEEELKGVEVLTIPA